jgi:hypothetical protein
MTLLSTVLAGLLWLAADGQVLTEVHKAALPQYFGFSQMQIYKLKPGISSLRLADLDDDGRTDVILWNGQRSRIELFYQSDDGAGGSDEALELNEIPNRGDLRNETVPVNYSVAWLEVAELTGDGRADIVFFGEPRELVILPGEAAGGFGAPQGVRVPEGNPRSGGFCVGDFNHDGRADVALLGSELLLIFHQKADGGLAPPQRLVHGIKNPLLMLRADLDGDGRDDLIIGADDDRHGAYVCIQEASGGLAAMRPIRVPRLRSISVEPSGVAGAGDDIYAIEYATNRLKHYRWSVPKARAVNPDWPMRLHSYPIKGKGKRRPVAVGDVDGDGLSDCLVVDPDAAQMVLFRGVPGGLGRGVAFGALADAQGVVIADTDYDGRQEVLVVSPEEKLIGVSRYASGRLTFPQPTGTRGEPFAVAVGSYEVGEDADCLAYVTREDGVFTLVVRPLPEGKELPIEVGELDDDPSGLWFADVDQDGLSDLVLFVRYATPRTYMQVRRGRFEALTGTEARTLLLKEATPAGSALADVTGDGKPELLVAQGNLVRALVVRDGRWTVVDQFNPQTADAQIGGLAVVPDEPGSPLLVMYERKAADLLVMRRRADNTYGVDLRMPVERFDLAAMGVIPLGRGRSVAVMLADATKLAILAPDVSAPTLVQQHLYETETRDAYLADAVVGDLNHDGVRDVAAVDMGKAAIEVLTTLPSGAFVRAMRFQVFQGKRFADAPEVRGEPREVLIGDVTGDGIDDVVLLVHDRLIVYPAQ